VREDLRYAVRRLLKDKAVTLALLSTIALGIGVNIAVFSMQNGLLRPLSVPAPGEIVVLAADTRSDDPGIRFQFSYPALQDFRKQAEAFIDLVAFQADVAGLSTGGKSVQILFSAVTGNYFPVLGVSPVIGRLFAPGEGENAGADLPVVLGYTFWQKRFSGDPAVIGRQIRLDGRTATVVGVTPRGFHGVQAGADMEGDLEI
jgi:putative ABC transport system permease protein